MVHKNFGGRLGLVDVADEVNRFLVGADIPELVNHH
jgi:hypothetical protein